MTIVYPDPPRASPRAPFPLIAVIAPLVAAVVIGAVIRSPYVLVFAALSPIIAVASALEARRAGRRQAREEARRFAAECVVTEQHIDRAHRRETELAFADNGVEQGALVGAAPAASSVAGAPPSANSHPDAAVRERLQALYARAQRNDRLPVRIPTGPVEVRGVGIIADRLRARLADQGQPCSPGAMAGATVITVSGLSALDIVFPDGRRSRADAVVPYDADERRRRAQHRAASLPERCDWAAVARELSTPGLAVGLGSSGPFGLDLIADGPHILVGGATGSGKSEFLRALALSAASEQGAWSVLYVDFKGGATFADLAELPSTVGVITDLDATLATRALTSLRAEIERRERVLARERVRDIADLSSGLSRLLIVVDEYAALAAAHSALQSVFADLSARGRSLGIHLVLCTQRPSGVVHDTVAVNCAIRVLFRTSDAADARALLGADAPSVSAAPRGRAVVRTSDQLFAVQVCLITETDIRGVAASAEGVAPLDPPWAPVLPHTLGPQQPEVARARKQAQAEGGLLVGVIDDVAAQRWSAAVWDPRRDGALAILGCAGSGRTTALAQLGSEARDRGWSVMRLPESFPDAQQVLTELAHTPSSVDDAPRLLLIDRLVDLLEQETPDRAAVFLGDLDAVARVLQHEGGGVAATVGTASTAGRLLTGRFGARLQLRARDVDDHHASGAPRGEYNDRAPAGRGWWRGHMLQVVHTERPLPQPTLPAVREVGNDPIIAVMSANPEASVAALAASVRGPLQRVTLQDFAAAAAAAAAVAKQDHPRGILACVAHPEEWQRDWAALAQARRTALIVTDGCDAGDLRALISARIQPPPIARRELWVIEPGQNSTPQVQRARWGPPSARPQPPEVS